MTSDLVPLIEYRDFWDFPRIFLTEYKERFYLFDCPFDDATEDFAEHYSVYHLTLDAFSEMRRARSWKALPEERELIGTIPVAEVQFDSTRRFGIQEDVFARLGRG